MRILCSVASLSVCLGRILCTLASLYYSVILSLLCCRAAALSSTVLVPCLALSLILSISYSLFLKHIEVSPFLFYGVQVNLRLVAMKCCNVFIRAEQKSAKNSHTRIYESCTSYIVYRVMCE